jgi:alkanesulfonate monooxygenase SsuD/methylene tetrahydromethanopterin reductase-like flavin-dependent oxidoreductase (luciferase family)
MVGLGSVRANAGFGSGPFKIGLFAANCSGGLAITNVPERWDASWASNSELALAAEEGGLDFLLPIARWIGFGGQSGFQSNVLETITWATGLLARTQRITVFATVHSAFFHPIVAAKQLATADHVSCGRLGLNIVAGWNKPEYDMFGADLPDDPDERYAFSQEWFDVVKRLWSEPGSFDFRGRYFKLENVQGDPKPLGPGRPPILNAGGSAQGQAFAQRNADILFTSVVDPDTDREKIQNIKTGAKIQFGREHVGVYTPCYVVCRPTDQEAHDYHRHYAIDNADLQAVELLMALTIKHTKTLPQEVISQMRVRYAGGHGTFPLIGSPETVVREIQRLARAGLDGITISFVNYLAELPYFVAEVLPRLDRAAVRPHVGS